MKKRIFWWVLVAGWCMMIFYQSSKPAVLSSGESGFITMLLNQFLENIFGVDKIVLKDGLIRKSAHFLEYTVLSIFFFNALLNVKKLYRTIVLSIAFSLIYSISDEIHQFFIPGRAMRIFDVGIDFLGIIVGVGFMFLLKKDKEFSKSRL